MKSFLKTLLSNSLEHGAVQIRIFCWVQCSNVWQTTDTVQIKTLQVVTAATNSSLCRLVKFAKVIKPTVSLQTQMHHKHFLMEI